MSVALRLQRTGKPKHAHYRVVAINKTNAAGGEPLEVIGHYHPSRPKETEQFQLDVTRADYWIKNGARPSETVASLIRRAKRTATAKKA
ncbi:MAG: 30S ribosomal protein S16 [Elusimicrobiales bacterium]|nr:30S ribosomal protein S16 [Elusimicrobiales bacterium]